MHPTIQPFFDPATWTVTYVVYQQERSECAIMDSVLDYDPKAGRTSTASADKVIALCAHMNCVSSGFSRRMRTPTTCLPRRT